MTEIKDNIIGQGQLEPPAKPVQNSSLSNLNDIDDATSVKLCYALYLASFVLPVFAPIAGLIFAYIKRSEAKDWFESHYIYLIRTFWICFLYIAIGVVTSLAIIGIFILIAAAILWIARIIVGLNYAFKKQPIPNPETWLV
ncbi:MAG: hypothetical protein AAB680_02265 [Pseudomonadota bacterium]|mgnify:CR=1 FL=1